MLQECLAEVELGDLSLRIQTPQRVGIDDGHIDQPPGKGRPVLPALSLHSIVLPELINCVHIALMNIVVKDYLRLGNSGRLIGAALLLDGGHNIDPAVCAEHEHGRLVVLPGQAAQISTLPCHRLAILQCLHHSLELLGSEGKSSAVRANGAACTDANAMKMTAESWGSVEVVEEEDAVGAFPPLDEPSDGVVYDGLTGGIAALTLVDLKAKKEAMAGDGEQLVADGCRLAFDDTSSRVICL